MEELPYVPASIVWETLSSRDLAALVRTRRSLRYDVEPFLYRRHAVTSTHSAVMWAVETAQPDKPETHTTALSTLDKVKQFCCLAPGALDLCYTTSLDSTLFDDALDQLERVLHRDLYYPWAPLHLAAGKGLDTLTEWLLGAGAHVDASGAITPLSLVISSNRISTAALLLAHGANPGIQQDDSNSLTVLHIACELGHVELAEQLLVAERIQADPTDLLRYYMSHGQDDAPAIVELLTRHGADCSDDLIGEFFHSSKWRTALALLRSKKHQDQMSPSLASDLLSRTCSSVRAVAETHSLHHKAHQGVEPGTANASGAILQ